MTDNPRDISRRDFIKLSNFSVLGGALRGFLGLKTENLSPETGSKILDIEKLKSVSEYEPLPYYLDNELVTFNILPTKPVMVNQLVDSHNFRGNLSSAPKLNVKEVKWIVSHDGILDRETKLGDTESSEILEETAAFLLENDDLVFYFSSKENGVQRFNLPSYVENVKEFDLLSRNCFKIKHEVFSEIDGGSVSSVTSYFYWDGNRITPITPDMNWEDEKNPFARPFPNNIASNAQAINQMIITDSNSRLIAFEFSGFIVNIQRWLDQSFETVAKCSYEDIPFKYNGEGYLPPVICLNESLGYLSLDREINRTESSNFNASFKIVDNLAHAKIYSLRNPGVAAALINDPLISLSSTTDIRQIKNALLTTDQYKKDFDEVEGIFVVTSGAVNQKKSHPWIVVCKEINGRRSVYELNLPQDLIDSLSPLPSPIMDNKSNA